MNELRIKKDGKLVFDSNGRTLGHVDLHRVIINLLYATTNKSTDSEVLVTIKSINSSPSSIVENELNNSVTKL